MKTAMTLALVCLWPAPGFAGEISSAYTTYKLDKCKRISEISEDSSGTYECKGYGGLKVYFAEGDLRTYLGYGAKPSTHCAAQQTFGHFNSVVDKIEWRLENGKPFAAIQRWRVSDVDDATIIKTWLGITRIEENNSCRVAVVEGALPDANEKARAAADQLARAFNCKTDEAKVISAKPIAIAELMGPTPCPAP